MLRKTGIFFCHNPAEKNLFLWQEGGLSILILFRNDVRFKLYVRLFTENAQRYLPKLCIVICKKRKKFIVK